MTQAMTFQQQQQQQAAAAAAAAAALRVHRVNSA